MRADAVHLFDVHTGGQDLSTDQTIRRDARIADQRKRVVDCHAIVVRVFGIDARRPDPTFGAPEVLHDDHEPVDAEKVLRIESARRGATCLRFPEERLVERRRERLCVALSHNLALHLVSVATPARSSRSSGRRRVTVLECGLFTAGQREGVGENSTRSTLAAPRGGILRSPGRHRQTGEERRIS